MPIEMKFKALFEAKMQKDQRMVYDTYADIAKALNVSPRTAFDLHRGKWAKLETIEAMCRYLDCAPGDLFVMPETPVQPKVSPKKIMGIPKSTSRNRLRSK